jgi:hypothetical protein
MELKEGNLEAKPKDLYEAAKESHSEDVKRWEEQIKRLDPIILKAKTKILELLNRKTFKGADLSTKGMLEDEYSTSGLDLKLEFEEINKLNKIVSEATVKNIEIRGNNMVFIADENFGPIQHYPILDKNQKKALEVLSLFSFLKNLPYQAMEKETGKSASRDLKDQLIKRDEEARKAWIAKRNLLEEIIKEFESLNISKGGTVTPSYIKGVE